MEIEREAHEVLGVARDADWPAVRRAFRSLARRFHPDGAAPDLGRMAEINEAYEHLERQRRSELQRRVPVGPGVSASWAATTSASPAEGGLLRRMAAARDVDSPVIDFGQYAGWRIVEVAAYDPRYLLWLSRHSSGVRYRAAISRVLDNPEAGRRAALTSAFGAR
jgi:curved DNA-binding protein CbpA